MRQTDPVFACECTAVVREDPPLTDHMQCIARKVPELCKSYTPGKTDQDIHVRLARLEQIIETALPHYWSQGHATPLSDFGSHDKRRSLSPVDDGNRSQPEDEDPSGGMFESGRWFGKSASGLVAAPAVLEQVSLYLLTTFCARAPYLPIRSAAKHGT